MDMSLDMGPVSGAEQTLTRAAPVGRAELRGKVDGKTGSKTGSKTEGRAQSAYRTQTVSTRKEILALAGGWRNLEKVSQGASVFQAFDLCLPWLMTYVFCDRPSYQARIITVHDQADALVALVPLVIRKRGRIHMAEWIGEPLIQYGDMLMKPAADKGALREAITNTIKAWSVDGIYLRNVRADSRIASVLKLDKGRLSGVREAAIADLNHFDDAEGYFNSFSKRSRKSRRRKRRDMEQQGSPSLECVKAGPQAVKLCDLALEWKKIWLEERGLSSRAFLDTQALEALRDMVGRQSDGNPLQLFVQKLNGTPVAIEVSLVGSEGCASFIGSYDPAFEELSPGKVQMESTIRYGYEQGWPAYDMLAPMSEYKQTWSNRTVEVADYVLPSSLLGIAFRDVYLRGLRPAVKALFMALPSVLRSRLLKQAGAVTMIALIGLDPAFILPDIN